MGPRYAYDSAYDSDEDSTYTSPRRHDRRRPSSRYRSRSEDDYYSSRSRRPPSPQRTRSFHDDQKTSSPYKTVGKVALGIIVIEAVAHFYSKWSKGKAEEREKERRRERKRQFEKAKARRRREEEKLERMQEERDRGARADDEFYEGSEVPPARRLGYVEDYERSPSRPPRTIEAPPEWDEEDEYEERRPERHQRSRSRPAVGVT